MSPSNSEISHVSDTALMVAACRALETVHPHSMVRDPFAAELAGERGVAILRSLPRPDVLCFGVGIRSRFLDELVMELVAGGKVDAVLCLGAGLDTRPWRLDLPETLRWIEVDFPDMLDYKNSVMSAHEPKCRLEQMAVDLNDEGMRRSALAAAGSGPALMMTEGLLMYLPEKTVEAIASEPAQSGGIRYWLMDVTSAEFGRRMRQDMIPIQKVQATDAVDGSRILEIVGRNGWSTVQCRSYSRDVMPAVPERIQAFIAAMPPGSPPPPPPIVDDPSGVHLFGRNGTA